MSTHTFEETLKHIWMEPKAIAKMEWFRDHPDPFSQVLAQVGRSAAEQFAAGDGWPDPDQIVTFDLESEEQPDWDWWEPRYDQPWRRQAARDLDFARRSGSEPGSDHA